MPRKPKRPLSAGEKNKHMSNEAGAKCSFDLDKNNNLNKLSKKPEINRSISLTNSYEKRNLISLISLQPSKNASQSFDNQLIKAPSKRPITFHLSKLPHFIKPTSATSLSTANQSPKLSSIKASSFDTTILTNATSSFGKATLSTIKINSNFLSLRPRSVSDCSNCILKSNLHLAHRAQHEFIEVIKRDRELINSIKFENDKRNSKNNLKNEIDDLNKTKQISIKNDLIKRLSTKKRFTKLNISDVVSKFREKHNFPDRASINRFKTPAICVDDYLFSWIPSGLTNEDVSLCTLLFFFVLLQICR